jgi:hypothetical protein
VQHFLAQGLDLDLLHELAYHRQGHVRLQQRHAHFPQGFADILLGDASLPAQVGQYATEPLL